MSFWLVRRSNRRSHGVLYSANYLQVCHWFVQYNTLGIRQLITGVGLHVLGSESHGSITVIGCCPPIVCYGCIRAMFSLIVEIPYIFVFNETTFSGIHCTWYAYYNICRLGIWKHIVFINISLNDKPWNEYKIMQQIVHGIRYTATECNIIL
jgi:hypothetical protein